MQTDWEQTEKAFVCVILVNRILITRQVTGGWCWARIHSIRYSLLNDALYNYICINVSQRLETKNIVGNGKRTMVAAALLFSSVFWLHFFFFWFNSHWMAIANQFFYYPLAFPFAYFPMHRKWVKKDAPSILHVLERILNFKFVEKELARRSVRRKSFS